MSKQILLEFLDFLKYKIENDLLTMEEVESISKTIESSLVVRGTIDDLARFFGKSNGNIRSLICRRMIDKPVRRVYYSFNSFRKIVPNTWRPCYGSPSSNDKK